MCDSTTRNYTAAVSRFTLKCVRLNIEFILEIIGYKE